MAEIISINGAVVKIGLDDGKVISAPIASLDFSNPQVGDKVKVYKDDKNYIVRRVEEKKTNATIGSKRVNKNVFVWVFTFLLGGFGVDRFVRGKVGSGVCKLLFGWLTFSIWALVDWIIAMTKAYGSAFSDSEELVFNSKGDYAK